MLTKAQETVLWSALAHFAPFSVKKQTRQIIRHHPKPKGIK